MSMITDEARAWAKQRYPEQSMDVGRVEIQRYAHAIRETDPIHFDVDAARAAGFADVVAPPLFPYVIRTHASNLGPRDALAPDGSALADVPPVDTERAMAGETTIEVGPPIVAGDTIRIRKQIVELYEKEGRSGPLVFVTMEFTFTNQRDETVATERFTRIYR